MKMRAVFSIPMALLMTAPCLQAGRKKGSATMG